jgi:hypothetical protein
MSRVPTVRKADLDRVLAALKAQGLQPASVVVRPGGEVVITPGVAAADLTPTGAPVVADPLDTWRAGKKSRGDRAA